MAPSIKVAHILPTSYLTRLSIESNFHLLLAHHVLNDEKYILYYKKRKKVGDYIILDNSAFEFDRAIPEDLLIRAITLVNPDEIVLPDELFDANATIFRASSLINSGLLPDDVKLMGVPHANNLDDWIECYKFFLESPQVDVIGLGAIYNSADFVLQSRTSDMISGREWLIQKLEGVGLFPNQKPHHLLGLGDSGHLELKALSKYPMIRSCDSSAAYVHGILGISFSVRRPYHKCENKIGLDDDFQAVNLEIILENIKLLDGVSQA